MQVDRRQANDQQLPKSFLHNFRQIMSGLNITLEEENIEQILEGLTSPEIVKEEVEKIEDMDTHGNILLKYKCDICSKRVMTSKGLKTHISRMHKKSLQRVERESKQQFSCDECHIKRSTEVLLKSHKKCVHGNIKRSISEMRRGTKTTRSPPSMSPPAKKAKEEEEKLGEEEMYCLRFD